ncbi:DHA2 family efflux MFS transporter permease subunit [Oceanobacillus longus]|uniref:DHA2 family efflux MFS transporter permease subunit n=1 Tax=Oceanobacillus longus TaxID=930120 RepID=A0ABV8H2S7_9BACI
MVSLMIGVFTGIFNQTALNMALTGIMDDFQIHASNVQWVTTGYILTMGILVPISGLLYKSVPTKKLFTISLGFSFTGTLLAGFSINFEMLLLARIIQAVGPGILMPLMTNIILVLFPPNRRGMVMGLMMLVIAVAPALGPTISGLLIGSVGWKGIFWVSIPLLLISLILGLIYMRNISNITKPKVDILSILLSTIGFGGIVFGFSSAGSAVGSWGQPIVIIPLTIGILSLILFSFRQFKLASPMLNLRVFKYPMFTIGSVLVFLVMFVNLSISILMPMYLVESLLLSALTAGLVLLPGGVFNGVTSLIIGRIFDEVGPKFLVRIGFFILIIMFLLFSNITVNTSLLIIIIIHTGSMFGVALIMNPAQTNGLNQLPKQLYPDGAAVIGTLTQIAGAIGVAIAISTMVSGQEAYLGGNIEPINMTVQSEALAAGVRSGFKLSVIGAIIGFITSLFIRRS